MKKNVLIQILLWVNLCVMMLACSKEDELLIGIGETLPFDFYIEVVNADGDNLLDPNMEDNLWTKGNARTIWNDVKYELNAGMKDGVVSLQALDFEGSSQHYVLAFHGFAVGVMPSQYVVIQWGDGSQDKILYDVWHNSINVDHRVESDGKRAYNVLMVIRD